MEKKHPPTLKFRCFSWFKLLALLFIFTVTSMCTSPPNPIRMTVLGHPHTLMPGSQLSLQVQLWHTEEDHPLAQAPVRAYLAGKNEPDEVFVGQTDEQGLATVQLAIPSASDTAHHRLVIEAEQGEHSVGYRQHVYVGYLYNVFLSTDKPVYQPGQTIHMRTLALDSQAMKAAQAQALLLTVQDPQGNHVMRRELSTSAWGIASSDFVLDSQASQGNYTITAHMGTEVSRRTVEVKPYKLPRFKVDIHSDKSFYLPGETAKLSLEAKYFFGKTLSGGQVRVEAYTTDVDRHVFFELNDGELNEQGLYEFDLPLPQNLVGQAENNTATVDLEITVLDSANHAESISESLTLAEQALLIEAIPESGTLRPGLENIIYVQVSYPNGQPVQADLSIDLNESSANTVQTNAQGLAAIRYTPQNAEVRLNITARDEQGQSASQNLNLKTNNRYEAVLLRPDKTAYQVGDLLNVDAFVAGQASTVFLDVVKGGQSFALQALPVQDGLARAEIPLDGSLLGTLELHAYIITSQGDIIRDRRLVLVDPAPSQVEVQSDASVYRPGDTAKLNVSVQHKNEAMPSVLGLSIVDESVFSVGAQSPSFARTYFLLERELLEPRYQVHGFAPLGSESSPYDRNYKGIHRSSQRLEGSRLSENRELARAGMLAQELALDDVSTGQSASSPELAEGGVDFDKLSQRNGGQAEAESQGGQDFGSLIFAASLLGLVYADKGKTFPKLFFVLLMMGSLLVTVTACAPAPAPASAPAQDSAASSEGAIDEAVQTIPQSQARAESPQRPRLRQFFPETLFWMPELETDENGQAQIEVPVADSITTWRVNVLASDTQGNLGSAALSLPVFQEFFIEPDLPRFLTQNDELAVPISIFNYLDEAQDIHLSLEPADWFEFVESPELNLQVAANEVKAAYIPIRVTGFGQGDFKVTAISPKLSDSVLRQVDILPDGKAYTELENGKLTQTASHQISLPQDIVPGSAELTLKVFPGPVSQVIEGLEGLLRQPHGCFEQTSSTTYPNILILDYLKTTNQLDPALQLKAEQYINLGYQRLLTFEVDGHPGGFSLFGDPPPWTMLSAYGLMEFNDMSQVSYVDPALISRTANYLFSRQQSDGSWDTDGMTVESGWERLGQKELPVTAYIAWALADAGYANTHNLKQAMAYIRQHANPEMDPYALAIVVNALVAVNPQDDLAQSLLDSLLEQAQSDGQLLYWPSDLPTYMGGRNQVASIESTAMIATALMRANYRLDAVQPALDFLISQRDGFGAFHNTQSTILSLKALILAAKTSTASGEAIVTINLSDGRSQTLRINDENANVVQKIYFDDLGAGQTYTLSLSLEGERTVHYQIISDYHVFWDKVMEPTPSEPTLRVDVAYDRTELAVNDTVQVQAEVELLAEGQAGTILVDLGLPPGFSPLTEDLEALIEQGLADRYELTGRQILLYLTDVPSGQIIPFSYRLRARFPIKTQTGLSQAYDYYSPSYQDTQLPQRIRVTLGTPKSGS